MVAFKNQNDANVYLKFIEVNCQAATEGKSVRWIGEQLGLSSRKVIQRRQQLRNRGVPLPDLQRGRVAETVDIEEANKLIAKLTGESLNAVKARSQSLTERQAVSA